MFAVIRTGGKQYRVAETDLVAIDRLAGEAGDTVAFGEVLIVGGDGQLAVGSPLVDGATVAGEIVAQRRSPKILVFKKRRRQNSKRSRGHRQDYTLVRITDILTGGAKPTKATAAAPRESSAEGAKPKAAVPPPAVEPMAQPTPAVEAAPTPAAKPSQPAGGDDLKKLTGVGPAIEKKLHALGVTTFAEVAAWTAEDIARVEESLNFKGRITRDDWVGQAQKLAAGEG